MKKQQVLVIHGGWAHSTKKDFLNFLSNKKVYKNNDPFWKVKNWRAQLGWHLGKNYDVIVPDMPSKDNAKYDQWKVWFERYFDLLEDNVILVGESLGGTFLIKYLSENKVPFKIRSLVLVAAGFDVAVGYSFGDFLVEPKNTENFSEKIDNLALFYSDNDPFVPLGEVEKVASLKDGCHKEVLHDRGHFSVSVIPELIQYMKEISEK